MYFDMSYFVYLRGGGGKLINLPQQSRRLLEGGVESGEILEDLADGIEGVGEDTTRDECHEDNVYPLIKRARVDVSISNSCHRDELEVYRLHILILPISVVDFLHDDPCRRDTTVRVDLRDEEEAACAEMSDEEDQTS